MRAWLPVCLLFGGCAQLAGIDDTSGEGRVGVSLTVERVSVGSTVVRTPQDLSANTATYLLDDGTTVDAIELETGTWSAEIFDGSTPPVEFDLPDDPGPVFDRQIALPNRDLLTVFDRFEHPGAVVSADTDLMTINATLDAAFPGGQTFQLFVVGTWTLIELPAPAVGALTFAPPPFPVSMMSPLTGRPIEQISVDDTVLILRRTGNTLDGFLEVSPFTQGPDNALNGAVTPVAANLTLSATIDQAAATAKLGVVRPAITAGPAFTFSLRAAPGAEAALTAGPLLAAGAPVALETTLTAQYANPFAAKGWPAALTYNGAGSRTLTPTGETLPVTLAASMSQTILDPAAGTTLDFPAAVPEQVSIGGQSLSLDNVSIPQPTTPIEVTMVVDRTNVTLFQLDVRELVPDVTNTVLTPVQKLSAVGLDPTFVLQPALFETGKLYSLRVSTISGLFPNIADGDLRTRELPVATAFVDVGVFRVVP